jgi:ADP-ribosylglycohydrolase
MSAARDRLRGLLVGQAVGDALGLPREGLSPRRARRMFGGPPLEHRFLLGRGMVSDDTEHACMTAQALLAQPRSADAFARSLAWRVRGWLALAPAGVGFATLRSGVKLWLGFPPTLSGVRSAGNGPAMRSPLLGACLARDPERLRAFVGASTRLSHTDPRAEEGALALALAVAQAFLRPDGAPVEPAAVFAAARTAARHEEIVSALNAAENGVRGGASLEDFAASIGCQGGVTGYIPHTLAAVLFCWLRRPDRFREAVEGAIVLGGDSDTTAAITGALAGASLGAAAIPATWLDGLIERPRSARWLDTLAGRLADAFADGHPSAGALPLAWHELPVRNAFFLTVVLAHVIRRAFPPY